MRPKKPKMLVVDDEPDNLDLLYRTFRREFRVFKAESGIKALEILANEGEVAVIISDQRMPEMKGTEFLSKTLPQFPNTVRIILTGFTDIEDLVDAINSGQVYKYITKPWDPNELKVVVQRAAETYELLKQRTEELQWAQTQTALLTEILQIAQEPMEVEAYLEPIAQAFGENFSADACILNLVDGSELKSDFGIYSDGASAENWLADDPLVREAIATKTIQTCNNIPSDSDLSQLGHYEASQIQAHLAMPITFRGEVRAILSLQWTQPCQLPEPEVELIKLAAQQVGLAMVTPRLDS